MKLFSENRPISFNILFAFKHYQLHIAGITSSDSTVNVSCIKIKKINILLGT